MLKRCPQSSRPSRDWPGSRSRGHGHSIHVGEISTGVELRVAHTVQSKFPKPAFHWAKTTTEGVNRCSRYAVVDASITERGASQIPAQSRVISADRRFNSTAPCQ